ncbi:hypothetical protein C357_10117 [Citreicella sp. 357]|nr:hypothetical protein C357_10117 [Citreicella sp. 357]
MTRPEPIQPIHLRATTGGRDGKVRTFADAGDLLAPISYLRFADPPINW